MQEFGISAEGSFTTAPAPGSDETVRLLAIADLGFCEEDGSMTYAGNYPNPIATLPVGTPAEIRQEVRPQDCLDRSKVLQGCACHSACPNVQSTYASLLVHLMYCVWLFPWEPVSPPKQKLIEQY